MKNKQALLRPITIFHVSPKAYIHIIAAVLLLPVKALRAATVFETEIFGVIIVILTVIIFLGLLWILNRIHSQNRRFVEKAEADSRGLNRLYQLLQRHDKKHRSIEKKLENSRENYRAIFDSIEHGILIIDPLSQKILNANSRFTEMCGFSRIDIIDREVKQIFWEIGGQPGITHLIKKARHDGELQTDWQMNCGPSGISKNTWVNLSIIPSRYDDMDCLLISISDISSRKNAELDVRTNNRYLNALLLVHQLINMDHPLTKLLPEILKVLVRTIDADAAALFSRNNGEKKFIKSAEFDTEAYYDLADRDDPMYRLALKTSHEDLIKTGQPLVFDREDAKIFCSGLSSADNAEKLVITPLFLNNDLSGLLLFFFRRSGMEWHNYETDLLSSANTAIAMLIERRQILDKLNERDRQFRTLSNNLQAAVFIVQEDSIIFANSRFYELSGLDRETNVWQLMDFVTESSRGEFDLLLKQLMNHDIRDIRIDLEISLPDRGINWIDCLASRIRFNDDVAFLFAVHDISDKKRTEKRLKMAQFSIDSAADPILWFNEFGRIIYANDRSCEHLAYDRETLMRKYIYEIDPYFSGSDWTASWQNLLMSDPLSFESMHAAGDGNKIPVECSLDIFSYQDKIYAFLHSRDIRPRLKEEKLKQELQEQLNRNERLESLGFMASGVAHEINNPMMGIINYSKIIFDTMKDDSLKNFAGTIIKEGSRISQIVSKLLDFANPQDEIPMTVDFRKILEDALILVGANLRKNSIILNNNAAEKEALIFAKKGAIQQVILNLLQNALYSLNEKYPDKDDNKIIQMNLQVKRKNNSLKMIFTVRDNGMGIPQENIPHLFTPYFTTKVRTEGTGLGLALSHNIIKDHGGNIKVVSREGQFAAFSVALPIHHIN